MAEEAITQGAIRFVIPYYSSHCLTNPSYRSIFEPNGGAVENPVLQCVQIKTMEAKASDANPMQRFRVVLSDIRNFIQTMVATSSFTASTCMESSHDL